MRLADNLDMHEISNTFEFRPNRSDFGNPHIRPCTEHSLFSFDWIFAKVTDNLDRHKISDEFEILARSDYSFWSYKKNYI